jgi:hypothetical protein
MGSSTTNRPIFLVVDSRGVFHVPPSSRAVAAPRPAERERIDTSAPSVAAQRHWQLRVAHLLTPHRI